MKTLYISFVKIFLAVMIGVVLPTKTFAQDMKTLFTNMPDSLAPQLEEAWRKDLIDLFQSGKTARLKNTMEGFSELQALTSDYLRLRTTDRSVMELKRLPLINNTYVICMIITVEGLAPDSRMQFFTTEWERLDGVGSSLNLSVADFLKADADTDAVAYKDAVARLDMDLMKYSLSPDNYTLTVAYSTPLYLNANEREAVSPFLKSEPVVYTWNRTAFVRE
jgi:hypothetical protein